MFKSHVRTAITISWLLHVGFGVGLLIQSGAWLVVLETSESFKSVTQKRSCCTGNSLASRNQLQLSKMKRSIIYDRCIAQSISQCIDHSWERLINRLSYYAKDDGQTWLTYTHISTRRFIGVPIHFKFFFFDGVFVFKFSIYTTWCMVFNWSDRHWNNKATSRGTNGRWQMTRIYECWRWIC